MKAFKTFLTLLLGLSIIGADVVEARGDGKRGGGGGGGGGGGRASAPNRSGGGGGGQAKRSPMTGSKVARPQARPQPKPASRPQTKPASRPEAKPAARPEARPSAKPAERPSVQKPSVQKPVARPDNRPGDNTKPNFNRPDNKPDNNKPDFNRPDNKPGNNKPDFNRPDNKPDLNRPDNKPGATRPGNGKPDNRPEGRPETKPMPRPDRPGANKPATLPGMVTYPDRPGNNKPNRPSPGTRPDNRPDLANRPNRPGDNNRPGGNNPPGANNRPDRDGPDRVKVDNSRDRNRVGNNNIDNSKNIHIDKVNVNRKNTALNRPGTRPAANRNWDNNRWGGNRSVWGNQVNIQNNVQINNNFRRNNNFSYRPNYWGARPWWGANASHGWHHGHWNYGWNHNHYRSRWYYDDDDFASGFMWGIGVWSLGNLIYDMGYQTYRNPYPAPPVQYNDSKSSITYAEPISVTAAAAPPGDEELTKIAETKSAEAVDQSRDFFKQGDYVAALKACDEAIAHTPGDVTLHEYRALVLFALGRYSDAAGVVNPVLASGPGWGWDTLVGFYDSSSTYDGQLRKLEAYAKGKPDGADAQFLLGYHYLVCGHMEQAYAQFDKAATLQPADSISRELRDLTKSSLPDAEGEAETPAPTPPPPVPTEKLVGTWVASPGSGGKITFKMEESGDFAWSFTNGEKVSELKGTYGLNDKGLLVLTTEDSQMVSVISLPADSDLKFVLVGSPDGDPGLDFKKG